jgi:hypothetical protein
MRFGETRVDLHGVRVLNAASRYFPLLIKPLAASKYFCFRTFGRDCSRRGS